MKIDCSKTKCLPFINSRTKDFEPRLSIEEGTHLDILYRLKLVGLVIMSGITWHDYVDYTAKMVNRVIWQLMRFKNIGASREKLIILYTLKIQSIIMFGYYRSYRSALSLTSLPRLDTLRQEACLKWPLETQKNPIQLELYTLAQKNIATRSKDRFSEYKCKHTGFYKSDVSYMARALNSYLLSVPIITCATCLQGGYNSSSLVELSEIHLITVFHNKNHQYNQ